MSVTNDLLNQCFKYVKNIIDMIFIISFFGNKIQFIIKCSNCPDQMLCRAAIKYISHKGIC